MAVAVTAATLRTLHRMHRQLADLQEQLSAGPRQVAARTKRLQAAEAACTRLSDDLAGMTEARHLSDAEAARLREQVDALQTLGAAPAADCPTVVADAILRLQ